MSHAVARTKLIALALALALTLAAPAAPASADARVDVIVIVTGGGAPVHGARILVERVLPGGEIVSTGSGETDDQGRSHLARLEPGDYLFSAQMYESGFPIEYWGGAADRYAATPFRIERAGHEVTIDMDPGGYITGRATWDGIPSTSHVWFWERHPNDGTGWASGLTFVESDGTYRVGPLRAGGYALMLYGGVYNSWWPGNVTSERSGTVHVRPGSTTTGVDFITTGSVPRAAGRVTRPDGSPLAGRVRVEVYTAAGVQTGWENTEADGTFSLWGLPRGTYTLRFVPYDPSDGDAVYLGGGQTLAEANRIVVIGGPPLAVDARLADLPEISWSGATVAGVAAVGGTLTAQATASTPGTRLAYQWFVADSPIPGATGRTFRPSTFYVHQHVRVAITASAPGHATATSETIPLLVGTRR